MCNCGNTITTSSVCSSCVPNDCACPIKDLSTDCIKYTGEDLPCTEILGGTLMTEAFSQLDTYLCDLSNQLANSFSLISVGAGTRVYKGVDGIGRKEIRSITPTNAILTVGLSTDNKEIEIGIDTVVLGQFVQANQITYAMSNVGTGANVYKSSTQAGNNVTFNLREIKSTDSRVIVTEGPTDIDITLSNTIPTVSGSVNYIPRFTPNGTTLGNSSIYQHPSTGYIAIGHTNPLKVLDINSDILVNGLTVGRGSNDNTNAALGFQALQSSSGIGHNVAVGFRAAMFNTTGNSNMALGYASLQWNTTGNNNHAIGNGALIYQASSDSVGNGFLALAGVNGQFNTAMGTVAAWGDGNGFPGAPPVGTGYGNTAIGAGAIYSLADGNNNTAVGNGALAELTNGEVNVAIGSAAGGQGIATYGNTAIGTLAMYPNVTGHRNTVVGLHATSTNFNESVVLGAFAQATGDNQFVIGSPSAPVGQVVTEANTSTKVWNVIINGVAYKILLA